MFCGDKIQTLIVFFVYFKFLQIGNGRNSNSGANDTQQADDSFPKKTNMTGTETVADEDSDEKKIVDE